MAGSPRPSRAMPHRVLFYVQHLLGIGHVIRAARISRALAASGFQVQIAFGGRPIEGIDWGGAELSFLPAVEAAPGGFSSLVTPGGEEVDDAFKQARTGQLLELLNDCQPDVLLIEAYPFARRIMRFELKPLIDTARALRPRPLIVSSIRDILQEGRKPERIRETVEIIHEKFDHVLVHGDEALATLGLSFPASDEIAHKVHYTGIVAPEAAATPNESYDVIVSAGGGAVGRDLFEAALQARPNCRLKDGSWLFVTGPNLSQADRDQLSSTSGGRVSFAEFRSDLPALLHSTQLSISQAGYNTMADVLRAQCRSVVVPFARGGETEQTRRASLLQARGLTVALAEDELSSERLAQSIDSAMTQKPGSSLPSLDGAETTARLLTDLLRER